MDANQIPGTLPATITRSRPLIMAVMGQSLAEVGPGSRTAFAWQWALTGHGQAPVTGRPGNGRPPTTAEIEAEARHGGLALICFRARLRGLGVLQASAEWRVRQGLHEVFICADPAGRLRGNGATTSNPRGGRLVQAGSAAKGFGKGGG